MEGSLFGNSDLVVDGGYSGGGMLESKHMTLFFSKRCQQFLYLHQMHSMNNLSSVHVIGSMVIFAII